MGVPDEPDLGQDHGLGNRQACQLSACILAEISIRTHSIHDTLGRDIDVAIFNSEDGAEAAHRRFLWIIGLGRDLIPSCSSNEVMTHHGSGAGYLRELRRSHRL